MSDIPKTRIDENAIKAWRITFFLNGLFLYIVPAFFYALYYFEESVGVLLPAITAPGAFVIHVIIITLLPKLRWNRWRYDVNDQGVDMLRGIIIKKRTIVPMNRVQHVDTKQGPIYRRYGLSSISLSTAATTHEIPALDDQTADELRTRISELVRKVREDV
ncbi:MAG: PH domain-containing protein [Balneolales bacterium]|nr:PH domain-containing protein [Balneolales bacterium]